MAEANSKLPRDVDLPLPVGDDSAKIFMGPDTLVERENWRTSLIDWKNDAAARYSYDDTKYVIDQSGISDDFNCALVWIWDELLFDFEKQVFTPDKLVADFDRFGGLDAIILWHAYPVIGVDSRNQFDFYNFIDGLESLISTFQKLKVKVFLNYNPWDRWTSRPHSPDQDQIAQLISRFGFDGVFLDTMKSADPDFMKPIFKVKPEVIVGGESRVQQERICDHLTSWAQWFADSKIPGVIRAKWFEPRHMLHQTRRWNRSHIDELQIAWINGSGMLIWEAVFGSWVGWNQRETVMWKEMVSILRKKNNLIKFGKWTPLSELSREAEDHGLFASEFSTGPESFFAIINRNSQPFTGLIVDSLSGTVPGSGVAAVFKDSERTQLVDFIYDRYPAVFPNRISTREREVIGDEITLEITYRNRECGLYGEAPFVDSWKPLPPNYHQIFSQKVTTKVRSGTLDLSEVTNRQFHEFVLATNYAPLEPHFFLKHWSDGKPKQDDLDQPVTFVDIDDAQAYAEWKGVVLPTEWEWQNNFTDKHAVSRWNLTDSVHSDGRTRFIILKGGSNFNVRLGQGAKSTSGIAESDWYVDGGVHDKNWVEKMLLMGKGLARSENISFRCFEPKGER